MIVSTHNELLFLLRYRGTSMVNHDPDVSVTSPPSSNSSHLTVEVVNHRHSGNYTCSPSLITPDWARVHVVDEEGKSPAATTANGKKNTENRELITLAALVVTKCLKP